MAERMTREQIDYFRTKKVTSSTGTIEPGFYRAFYPGFAGNYYDIYVLGMSKDDSRVFNYITLNVTPAGEDGRPGYPYIASRFLSDAGVTTEADGYIGNNFLVPMIDVRRAYAVEAWEKPRPEIHANDIISIEVFRPFGGTHWETRVKYYYDGAVQHVASIQDDNK